MNLTRSGRGTISILYNVKSFAIKPLQTHPCRLPPCVSAGAIQTPEAVSNPAEMRRRTVVGVLVLTAAVAVAAGALSRGGDAGRSERDLGIPLCPASALDRLLSPDALQCWLDAPNGRWRIVGHESVHRALVVHVEAAQL